MKSDKLQDAIGEVNDFYIQDAEKKVTRKKNAWFGWIAAAACVCLLIGMVYVNLRQRVSEPPVTATDLPKITLPEYITGGMGFEAKMCYDAKELDNGNPWNKKMKLKTLPVFKNGSYDSSGAGIPIGFDEATLKTRLEDAAKSLDLDLTQAEIEVQRVDEEEVAESGAEEDAVYGICASTDEWRLTVEANGFTRIHFLKGCQLPEQYHFTRTKSTDQETEDAMKYLISEFASFLSFDNPQIVLGGEYYSDGEYFRKCLVYDCVAAEEEKILNYHFRHAKFTPDFDGNLSMIDVYDELTNAEKIGDYPIISEKEATQKLLNGQYQTSVSENVPGKKYIVKTELVYITGPLTETFLPYYRFYIELPDTSDYTMAEGLKMYGAYYVPAIPDECISNLTIYDGRIN